VIDGSLSLGSLIAFNVYIGMLIWPLRMLGMIVAQGQRAVAAADRVDEVLATDPAIADPARPQALPPGGGEVRFAGVRFAYGEGAAGGVAAGADGLDGVVGVAAADGIAGADTARRANGAGPAGAPAVLDGFDLRIAPGESVALVGATGSGKSTVARLLARFYDVDAGAVSVDGVDVRQLRLRELRRSVGIVFEDTFLFSDTIAANIAFADPDAPHAAIERAARLAGAHEFISELGDGFATRIGERGYSLSGGQRQRIAIARAILADPRVLILDDATSAVDPTKEHEIRDALTGVMRGRTTIVIAHRPATIALADRVVLVDAGKVAAEGTHESLLATDHRYRQVLAAAAARESRRVAAGADGNGEGAREPEEAWR
jgi:ATP-binding cassette subfamily B protein